MKILMIVHQFLPRHLAGSEVYTYHLAQALRARGHFVELFFTEIRSNRPQYELTRGKYDGIPYFEAVHNRAFESFRHTYSDPEMERLFRTVLDQSAPDVIHLQHLHLHSIGYIDIARQRCIPLLYTLHEYMLMCLNEGRLLRPGSIQCEAPETRGCAQCAAAAYPHVPIEIKPIAVPSRFPWISTVSNALGFSRSLKASNGCEPHEEAVLRRRSEIQTALDKVNLFVAPSRFLQQRFVGEGMIPPERIVYSDYGFFIESFKQIRRRPSQVLRTGYIGTISEYKGVQLIVDAFREIREPGIDCRIYGDLNVFPDFKERLLRLDRPPAVQYMGRLENERIAEALADLDLLIVPSLWFENSPLTIHEAYLAGLPVLTSDCGGMAELVEHNKSGLQFRTGDAADLRHQLLRILREPGLLASLRSNLPVVKTIEQEASQMEERYTLLLQDKLPEN